MDPCFVANRLSVPAPGRTLSAATEERAKHVRRAVSILAKHYFRESNSAFRANLESLHSESKTDRLLGGDPSLQAAWNSVCIRIVGRLSGSLAPSATFADAYDWFAGSSRRHSASSNPSLATAHALAIGELERIQYDSHLSDLLPYVIDHHGPGSRASVRRNPSTSDARRRKRECGSYYTPADVAEYVVRELLADTQKPVTSLRFLDPACGTGVFLRAVIAEALHRNSSTNVLRLVESSLFGFDIDPIAVDGATFVLLLECLIHAPESNPPVSPIDIWRRLQRNILAVDATLVAAESSRGAGPIQGTLLLTKSNPREISAGRKPIARTTVTLGSLHPALKNGVDILLGNPPYSKARAAEYGFESALQYESLRGKAGKGVVDTFPLFVEMMWRLTRPGDSSAGLVLPLSIACQNRAQLRACRSAISLSGGRWRFAFFDREPHALFGEDVKTRNAIVFRRESTADPNRGVRAEIHTGPLRKWTSRSRARLFDTLDFVAVGNPDITDGVPKLGNASAAQAYRALQQQGSTLANAWSHADACPPSAAAERQPVPTVFVASTAYNFLNVFLPHARLPATNIIWSENKVHRLRFATDERAQCTMAILSSRLTYWMWHVKEDGFHVTKNFIANLPFDPGTLSNQTRTRLAALGRLLWVGLQEHQIVSHNAGRKSVAYRPLALDHIREKIDALLVESAGLPRAFVDEISSFVRTVTVVDEADPRRRELFAAFAVQRNA